ncbi:hypothetical protein Patl1_01597 [Pistacia atlantica]|uniref:Uncharacterized protein n=1 Tax=Pistacia atlantica TaxID=434234 RepID=A0ACC1CDD5_9ROSI|nr:hypothetical protein Patl1_01597 [Pistacia atlantica]
MALKCFWVGFILFSGFWLVCFCDQDGFLSLTCGGTTSYVDSSNISWVSDSAYINTGNKTTVPYVEETSTSNVSVRFFPDSRGRSCYKLPVKNVSSLVLVRSRFVYKNYDGLNKPPSFSVSLGTATTVTVDLATNDPWAEEFLWPVNKDALSFCLHRTSNGGNPVISSLEVRPLPQGAYKIGLGDFPNKLLRKSYRIDCGYTNGSVRYPLDPYDRIWDADKNFVPFHVSTGFNTQASFSFSSIQESPPVAVLQTARVLARRDVLTYNFPLDTLGDYFIVLYFAGIIPVSPTFNVLINGDVAESNYTVRSSEAGALYFNWKAIKTLNITIKSISFYPLVNAIEVYEIVGIPLEVSSTTVSALQVIQQSTGLDVEWEDDPCSPKSWDHIGCEGSLVTSLELSGINLRSISPAFADLLDLKALDLHNTSLTGEIQNLDSLQNLERLNLSFNKLTSFGSTLGNLASLQVLSGVDPKVGTNLHFNILLREGTCKIIVYREQFPTSGESWMTYIYCKNVENNKLEGSLPDSLKRDRLEIRYGTENNVVHLSYFSILIHQLNLCRTSGNLCLSFSTMTCDDVSSNPSIETPQVTIVTNEKRTKHNHIAIILGASGGALLAVFFVTLLIYLYARKRATDVPYTERAATDMRNWNAAKVFSYKEIKSATNNFKEVLGRGSFGSVYLGKLADGKVVAVKVRFDRTQLGADSFINEVYSRFLSHYISFSYEVYLLSQIRHQNLVCLEGFCYESKQQILVYEYLPCGSLADHLYGPNSKKISLSWVRRLKIAVDAAKGM